MLGGHNTNVRHRGVLFHVQTEDSGRANPRLITHLYRGGTILASERCDYREHLEAPDLPRVVKSLVEAQHGAMVKRLRSGEFDTVIQERLGADVFGDVNETRKRRAQAAPSETLPERPRPAPFGAGIVSEKPLDEVVVAFLVENARKRKLPSK